MTARMLVVLLEEQEAAAVQGMATLVALARADRAVVRLAYLHRMPSPRMDRHGRVVADSDREMARITGTVVESLRLAARPYADVEIEAVARFGAPGSELGFELDAFAPTLVTFLTARADGPLARLQPWALRTCGCRRCDRCRLRVRANGWVLPSSSAWARSSARSTRPGDAQRWRSQTPKGGSP